jgi:hypothetical protein
MTRGLRTSLLLLLLATPAGAADDLAGLSARFWRWRAWTQPITGDDIPRVARPPGWVPDWSAAAVAERRKVLAEAEQQWRAIPPRNDVPAEIDRRLLGSAIARVHWELDRLAGWRRNPGFYVDQTEGAVFDLLQPPPPFDDTRSRDLVRRVDAIPGLLDQGRANLDQMRAPFVRLAVESLQDIEARFQSMASALAPQLTPVWGQALGPSARRAGGALGAFRGWLEQKLPGLPEETAAGRDNYLFFLREVGLVPFTPEQLVAMGRQELDRALTSEAIAKARGRGAPPLAAPGSAQAVVDRELADEPKVRKFLEEKELLTLPAWLHHYRFRVLPAYLAPIVDVGQPDDLTGVGRLDQDGTAWVGAPSPDQGYFESIGARDPRFQIAHEGMHYFQAALSAANPDPARRQYYDSGTPEGLAFYTEEMLLLAGLFDDSPHAGEIIYNMMRLRALRVEVDVKLALGEFTPAQAEQYLVDTVPMDRKTARGEAALFSTTPGQAISYQIGKLQILRLIADARLKQGEKFRLLQVHDFLFTNGYLPLSLIRWQVLGLRDEVDRLEKLR